MKTEKSIAKENVERGIRIIGDNPEAKVHAQTCQRTVVRLNKILLILNFYDCGYHTQLKNQIRNDKKDNQDALKVYKENGI